MSKKKMYAENCHPERQANIMRTCTPPVTVRAMPEMQYQQLFYGVFIMNKI